jgi:hypothetical protein
VIRDTNTHAQDLDAAYQAMAQDQEQEAEALEWAEATVADVGDEDFESCHSEHPTAHSATPDVRTSPTPTPSS